MKKLFALLMACIMVITFAACSEKEPATSGEVADNGQEAAAPAEIDLKKEGTQTLGDKKVNADILKKTVEEYLEGTTIFAYSDDDRTYADFVEYIGCEANEYQYNASKNEGTYIWRAADDTTAWFAVTFCEEDGKWKLNAAGSANLGL